MKILDQVGGVRGPAVIRECLDRGLQECVLRMRRILLTLIQGTMIQVNCSSLRQRRHTMVGIKQGVLRHLSDRRSVVRNHHRLSVLEVTAGFDGVLE